MESEKFSCKVEGMICPQCEDEIAQKLLFTRGIINCEASYRKNTVTAEYDPKILSKVEIENVLSSIGYPVGDGQSGKKSDFIALLAVLFLYILLPEVTALVRVPVATNGTSFGSLFIIGLLTGVHCIGMCGGIMLSQRNALIYNGCRILSYTLVGAIFGALGKTIVYDVSTKSMLLTLCGLLVVLMGLKMWGVPLLRKISPELPKPCRFRGSALVIGLFTGIMPCGMLSSMWILAASS